MAPHSLACGSRPSTADVRSEIFEYPQGYREGPLLLHGPCGGVAVGGGPTVTVGSRWGHHGFMVRPSKEQGSTPSERDDSSSGQQRRRASRR